MKIEVIPEDIERGIPGHSEECPIALALYRKGFVDIRVISGSFFARETRNGLRVIYNFPSFVSKWIEDFDKGKDVDPISFTARKGLL